MKMNTMKSAATVVAGFGVGAVAVLIASTAAGAQDGQVPVVTQDQVEKVWAETVASSKLTLPKGLTLPEDVPTFFEGPGGDEVAVYEYGLFDSVAKDYWRCAWLDVDLSADSSPEQKEQAAAELATFADIQTGTDPSVVRAYEAQLVKDAEEMGISASELAFSADCEGWKK